MDWNDDFFRRGYALTSLKYARIFLTLDNWWYSCLPQIICWYPCGTCWLQDDANEGSQSDGYSSDKTITSPFPWGWKIAQGALIIYAWRKRINGTYFRRINPKRRLPTWTSNMDPSLVPQKLWGRTRRLGFRQLPDTCRPACSFLQRYRQLPDFKSLQRTSKACSIWRRECEE